METRLYCHLVRRCLAERCPTLHSLSAGEKRILRGGDVSILTCLARQSRGVRLTHWVGEKKKKITPARGTVHVPVHLAKCGVWEETGSVARTCRRSSSSSSFQKLRFKPGTWLLTREAPLLSLCFTTTALSVATESSSAKSSLVYWALQDGKTATCTLQ